jgi:hypothetical protein
MDKELELGLKKAKRKQVLADVLGISKQFMYQILNGWRPLPADKLEKLDEYIKGMK